MVPNVDKPEVSVDEMVAALDSTIRTRRIVKGFEELTAARDYILTSAKEIDAKDAEATRLHALLDAQRAEWTKRP